MQSAFVTPCGVAHSAQSRFISRTRTPTQPLVRPAATPVAARGTRRSVVVASAAKEEGSKIVVDENIGGFCSINPRTGKREELPLREKEKLFLDAMQAYFRGETDTTLSNEEFDELKEELTWQGSEVTTLNRDEFMFLDAARAFEQGEKIMDDEEFDRLKRKLQDQGSVVAIQRGPRCSIQRQVTFSDTVKDSKRIFSLYIPAGLVMGLVWLSGTYEFTPLRNVDPVLSLFLGTPFIYLAARIITSAVLPNPNIVVGDCPSCGRRIHVFFGRVLNLDGYKDVAEVKCEKCKAKLSVEEDSSRMILIEEGAA